MGSIAGGVGMAGAVSADVAGVVGAGVVYRVIKFWNTFCFYIIYKIHHTSVPDKRDMEKMPVSCSTLSLY